MTSAPPIPESLADDLRWSVKPDTASPTGYVDGAWWPRSGDLATEIPPLLAELDRLLGRVERVSYRFTDWSPTPRKIVVDGQMVRLSGFRTQPTHTLDLHSSTRRLTLLVVPPATDDDSAGRALQAAGRPDGADDIAGLLASPDLTPTAKDRS